MSVVDLAGFRSNVGFDLGCPLAGLQWRRGITFDYLSTRFRRSSQVFGADSGADSGSDSDAFDIDSTFGRFAATQRISVVS